MLLDKINALAFAISLGCGLLIVYVLSPKPRIVVRFPTPASAGRVVYEEGGACYKYRSEDVDCEVYKHTLRPQPVDDSGVGPMPVAAASHAPAV